MVGHEDPKYELKKDEYGRLYIDSNASNKKSSKKKEKEPEQEE